MEVQTIRQGIVDDERVGDIITDITLGPGYIVDKQREHAEADRRLWLAGRAIDEIAQQVAEIKGEIAFEVQAEITTPAKNLSEKELEKFKPKPLFSNVEARTHETQNRCKSNKAYMDATMEWHRRIADQFTITQELIGLANDVKYAQNQFGANKSILEAVAALCHEETNSAQLKRFAALQKAVDTFKGETK